MGDTLGEEQSISRRDSRGMHRRGYRMLQRQSSLQLCVHTCFQKPLRGPVMGPYFSSPPPTHTPPSYLYEHPQQHQALGLDVHLLRVCIQCCNDVTQCLLVSGWVGEGWEKAARGADGSVSTLTTGEDTRSPRTSTMLRAQCMCPGQQPCYPSRCNLATTKCLDCVRLGPTTPEHTPVTSLVTTPSLTRVMWACIMAFSRHSGMQHSSTLSCTMALPLHGRPWEGCGRGTEEEEEGWAE